MAFRWLVAFLNNCISTKIDGPFESFRFFNQEITLVAGLALKQASWVRESKQRDNFLAFDTSNATVCHVTPPN
jgi:hypothetical protein